MRIFLEERVGNEPTRVLTGEVPLDHLESYDPSLREVLSFLGQKNVFAGGDGIEVVGSIAVRHAPVDRHYVFYGKPAIVRQGDLELSQETMGIWLYDTASGLSAPIAETPFWELYRIRMQNKAERAAEKVTEELYACFARVSSAQGAKFREKQRLEEQLASLTEELSVLERGVEFVRNQCGQIAA